MNENHHRVLAAALLHIDELLGKGQAVTRSAGEPGLARYAPDFTPTQSRVVADQLERLRGRIAEAFGSLGMAEPRPRTSVSRAVETYVQFAQVDLEDVRPERLRGYGALGLEAAAAIERVITDLDVGLRRVLVFLAQGSRQDLAARIERLGDVPVERSLLEALERVITNHGLVEYRGALTALLEKLESRTFEIAVFGRVSSGKSSLLNHLLGMDILPVGVTPVTTVPTRIVWGPDARVDVAFAEAPSVSVALERLAEYVTEEGNPANVKRVVRLTAEIPSPCLGQGMAFVDTPGVGSLGVSGAREAFAYLPRCDLGLVLVDAGGVFGRDDLDLVGRLAESGVRARVLLSKADLVSGEDANRMTRYVAAEIERELGLDIPVTRVSTVGAGAELASTWFGRDLAPLLSRARTEAELSSRRKLAQLCASVLASLRAEDPDRRRQIDEEVLRAQERLRVAERKVDTVSDRVRALGPTLADVAAREILRSAEDVAAVERTIAAAGIEGGRWVREEIVAARDEVRASLRAIGQPDDLEVDLLGQPVLAETPLGGLELQVPFWARLSSAAHERALARRLHGALDGVLGEAFSSLGSRLRVWGREVLVRLGEELAQRVEPLRARAAQHAHDVDVAALESRWHANDPASPTTSDESLSLG